MVKYFCTTDLIWLQGVNARGHKPGNGTQTWFNIKTHPEREEYAAEIEERQRLRMHELLSAEELEMVTAGLKTEEQMRAEGWFPSPVEEGVG